MAKYLYALEKATDLVVSAESLAGSEVLKKYQCIGCEGELIAKVNGAVMQPHFAHKAAQECSGETYLHKLGKKIFFETYQRCLLENKPFLMKLQFQKTCHKFPELVIKTCNLGKYNKIKSFDLTQYYSEIEMEKRDDSFIPDLLLKSTKYPEEKIYIEIAVTHFLSIEKKQSGKRIIEIPIETENDVHTISDAELSAKNALFLGFNLVSEAITDEECLCASRNFFAFYVYQSGKAYLEVSTLSNIQANLKRLTNKIIYSNILEIDDGNELMHSGSGGVFIDQVYKAFDRNIRIKNCFLCRYKGENRDVMSNLPIYCKGKKMKCESNFAAECDWYKPEIKKDIGAYY